MKQVKLKRTFKINFDSNEEESKDLIVKSEFSENGLLLKETDFYANGEIFLSIENSYNKDNKIIETITRNYEVESEERVEYHYENGLLVRQTEYFNDGKSKEFIIRYNSDSKILEKIESDEDGILCKKTHYDYYQKIKLETHIDDEGEVFQEIETHFDDNGNALKIIERDNSPYLKGESETHNTFDKNNNLVNLKIYEKGEVTLKEDYFFNDANVEYKSIGYDSNTDETIKILREIDSNNLVTKEKQFQNDMLVFSFVKEYDKNKQLIMEKHWSLDDGYGNETIEEMRYEYIYY